MTWVQTLWPGFIQEFDREVPEEMWTPTLEEGASHPVAGMVACPCGGEPEVPQNGLEICPGECGRVFLLLGETIRVAKYEPDELGVASEQ